MVQVVRIFGLKKNLSVWQSCTHRSSHLSLVLVNPGCMIAAILMRLGRLCLNVVTLFIPKLQQQTHTAQPPEGAA